MVDWSFEDGEDEAKGVYIAKLKELKKVKSYLIVVYFCLCSKGKGVAYTKCNLILWF